MSEKTKYRITTRRPIGGRMRNVGETVDLTPAEEKAELGWGGLEPVAAEEPAAATRQRAKGA